MTYTVEYYQDLVTSEHQSSSKYMAWLGAMVEPLVVIQEVNDEIISNFDIDTAIGQQLDIVGQWIGLSRDIPTPITGVFYSVNGTADEGVGLGILKGALDPGTELTELPDDIYRVFLKIKIAENHWDGTIPGIYESISILFNDTVTLAVIDNQDMSMSWILTGVSIGSGGVQYIQEGNFPFKPEGVRIKEIIINPGGNPIYAVNFDNDQFAGVNEGYLPQVIPIN